MNRRDFMAKLGAFAAAFPVAHEIVVAENDKPPLFVNFVVDPEIAGECILDADSVQKMWRDAFGGNPPCPLLVTVGGRLHVQCAEPTTQPEGKR